jgi:hypothetical protein
MPDPGIGLVLRRWRRGSTSAARHDGCSQLRAAITQRSVLLFGHEHVHPVQMLDTVFKLFDQSWFGLLISTALAIYSVVLTIRMASRQQLSFVTSEGSVLEPTHPSWKDDLKILYKDLEIPRLTAARLGIWNSGNSTIYGNQIVEDDLLRFEVDKDARILTFHVSSYSRRVVKPVTERLGDGSVSVGFDFLDPGDGFVVFVAHTSPLNSIRSAGTVRGLVAGATPWTKQNAYRLMSANEILAGPLLVFLLYVIFAAVRKILSIGEGSTASSVMALVYLICITLSFAFSKNVARSINSLVLRRVPKVISKDEALRARLMSGK